MKLVFALIYICWMTRGKSLEEGYWDEQRYIAPQGSVSTGLVMAVKCYLLVLVLIVLKKVNMWKRQEREEKRCRERSCLLVLCSHPAFISRILRTQEVPLLAFSCIVCGTSKFKFG